MAVVVDSIDTTPALASGATSLNLTTLTVGVGANRALYATLVLDGVTSSATATWDFGGTNQAATLLGSVADSSSACKIYVFGLVAPTSGSLTLRATWTGTADACLSAASFTGVNQAGGSATFAHLVTAAGNIFANASANFSAVGSFTSTPSLSAAFPGQAGNPVGFAAAPGYPGSLTPFSGSLVSGTSGAHQVYSFFDFNNGTFPNLTIGASLQYIDFIGCRFQSNANTPHPAAPSSSNIHLNGAKNITFSYCSWTPLASKYTIPPNYGSGTAAWPASGAGHNVVTQVGGLDTDPTANAIIETDAYTYGLLIETNTSGPVSLSHCDFWGFGNAAIDWNTNTTAQFTVDNCWIHDNAAWGSTNDEHIDALGYLLGTSPPSNITISNCTVACIGNNGGGDGLAWQGGTANFNNINHIHNYISGYGYTIILAGGDLGGIFTNSQFINNVIGTDVQAYWGFLYQDGTIPDYSPMFSANGNSWHGNTINVVPGTTYASTVDTRAQFTGADNGLFFLPNGTYSATDFSGGTSANATAAMQVTGSFSAAGKIPSLTVSAKMPAVSTLSAGLGSRFFSGASMVGTGAFNSRAVGPSPDVFVVGPINSGPINSLAINRRIVRAIEIFQSVGMSAAAAFAVTRGIPALKATMAMAGNTAFATSGIPGVRATSTMPAVGALVASEFLAVKSTAVMPSVGLLTAGGRTRISRSASMASVALFVTAATVGTGAAAALPGISALSIAAFRAALVAATMPGAGSLVVSALPPLATGAAAMNSAGVFSLSSRGLVIPGASSMAGVGAINFLDVPAIESSISMSALSALSAIANTYSVASSLPAASAFSLAGGSLVVLPTVGMAGLGGINLAGLPFVGRNVSMAGTGVLFAAVNQLLAASAMVGASRITLSGAPDDAVSTIIAATAALSASASPEFAASLAFAGLSTLISAGLPADEVIAAFNAAGVFSIAGSPGILPGATFLADAEFSLAVSSNVNAIAAFTADTTFMATAHLPAFGASVFEGVGELVASYSVVLRMLRLSAPPYRSVAALPSHRTTILS